MTEVPSTSCDARASGGGPRPGEPGEGERRHPRLRGGAGRPARAAGPRRPVAATGCRPGRPAPSSSRARPPSPPTSPIQAGSAAQDPGLGHARPGRPCPSGAILYFGAFGSHAKKKARRPPRPGRRRSTVSRLLGLPRRRRRGRRGPSPRPAATALTFPQRGRPHRLGRDRLPARSRASPYGDPKRPGGQHGPAKRHHARLRRHPLRHARSPTSSPTNAKKL